MTPQGTPWGKMTAGTDRDSRGGTPFGELFAGTDRVDPTGTPSA